MQARLGLRRGSARVTHAPRLPVEPITASASAEGCTVARMLNALMHRRAAELGSSDVLYTSALACHRAQHLWPNARLHACAHASEAHVCVRGCVRVGMEVGDGVLVSMLVRARVHRVRTSVSAHMSVLQMSQGSTACCNNAATMPGSVMRCGWLIGWRMQASTDLLVVHRRKRHGRRVEADAAALLVRVPVPCRSSHRSWLRRSAVHMRLRALCSARMDEGRGERGWEGMRMGTVR